VLVVVGLAASPDWLSYVIIRRFTLDANHAWVSLLCMAVAAATALLPAVSGGRTQTATRALSVVAWTGLAMALLSGALMFAKVEALAALTRPAYTGLELGLALALLAAVAALVLRLATGSRVAGSDDR
jgi:hypothetical protein